MPGSYALGLTYLSLGIFVVGLVYRGLKIRNMPLHLRWELAPVPHEKGKAQYGGSYFEEYEWWTKSREKSLVNEMWYMFQEIVLLKGVWEHKRTLWFFSFPFHFGGLYLPATMAGLAIAGTLLQIAGVELPGLHPALQALAAVGYVLGTIGVLGLLFRRLTDAEIKPFTTVAALFNLLFLLAVFGSGAYCVFATPDFSAVVMNFVKALLVAQTGISLPGSFALHLILGMLFLIYLPFTYMMHFVAKYFTYHEVRWNDQPMVNGSRMEKEVQELLGQPVSWAAQHINGEGKKNWVDIATAEAKGE